MPHDEAELLARWRAGDDSAGQAVCERHHQLVARIVAAYRPRAWTREDLEQEVFVTMFTRSASYAPRAGVPFAHWLSRLAVNVCRDCLRSEARRPESVELSRTGQRALTWLERGAGSAEPDAELDAAAAREVVELLMSELAPAERLVLSLLDIEGQSVAEVACCTGWSKSLVKVRAFRARRRLRAIAERRERGAR
ncbi:MAG: sigma-70 family RNA polymerase sigma factor [Planctomycetes bacterium]|nr:sigma-70 family RNA polymerase sigma factor [Planctomycetota bacterium]